jgi:hypothetical protein
MRKGGRNASGIEPIRFKRSMLGSSERRMWASSAAIALLPLPREQEFIDRMVLRLGGDHQKVVRIVRTDGRPQQ